jgi:hypothetical protein
MVVSICILCVVGYELYIGEMTSLTYANLRSRILRSAIRKPITCGRSAVSERASGSRIPRYPTYNTSISSRHLATSPHNRHVGSRASSRTSTAPRRRRKYCSCLCPLQNLTHFDRNHQRRRSTSYQRTANGVSKYLPVAPLTLSSSMEPPRSMEPKCLSATSSHLPA